MLPFIRRPLGPKSARSHRNTVSSQRVNMVISQAAAAWNGTLTDLGKLVERFAAAIPELNLDGDEQEEYSTMLLRLQNQVETGEPSEASWASVWIG